MIEAGNHFTFSHQALPTIVNSGPNKLFSMMVRGDKKGVIIDLLEAVCKYHGYPLDDQILSEIHVDLFKIGRIPIILIKMPQPSQAAQAHFIAIVLVQDGMARYFTLEAGAGDPGTFLCELQDGKHMNYGSVDKEDFIIRISEVISS